MPLPRLLFPLFLASLLSVVACGNELASVRSEDVLFQDRFAPGETGRWLLEADEAGRMAIQDERLVIEINSPQTIQFATLEDATFTDFVLEVGVIRLAGDLESSVGVLFRLQNPNQFYRFEITGNGLYVLERRDEDGKWTRLTDDWLESPAIRQGLNVTNRLKVVAIGPILTLHVNDQLLIQTSDSAFAAGKIALDAGTFGRAGLRVAFDDLVVARP